MRPRSRKGDDYARGAKASRFSSSSPNANTSTSASTRGVRDPQKMVPLPRESICSADFSSLHFDVMIRIAGSFSWPDLWSASQVCKGWNAALEPLRQGMLFVLWGKKWKHGRGGVSRNLDKALDSFLKGARRGCTAAMVDAGLLLWEEGKMEEAIHWYKRAADLGDPAGQCSLGRAYLQGAEPCGPLEAVKWFHRAALAGHARAQYNLALCLQHGRGIAQDMVKASRWYLRGAEGGSTKAMYNTALCFAAGQGFAHDKREARRWMRCAAHAGHRKAQHEHAFALYEEGNKTLALTYLELAIRGGESAGTIHLRDSLSLQLPPKARAHSIAVADLWEARRVKHR